jgi:hypothetical protein
MPDSYKNCQNHLLKKFMGHEKVIHSAQSNYVGNDNKWRKHLHYCLNVKKLIINYLFTY